MRRSIAVLLALMLISGTVLAQQPDSTAHETPEMKAPPKTGSEPGRFYYGGTIGLSFGDYSRFSVSPLVGYRLAKMWSVGGRFIYEYIKDKRYTEEYTASNYGGSLFARFRPTYKMYLHGEYAYMSYDYTAGREWVPFLLLGGGYVQPISKKASFFIEVLFDVLQDDKSPYKDWEPWISVGVAAGF